MQRRIPNRPLGSGCGGLARKADIDEHMVVKLGQLAVLASKGHPAGKWQREAKATVQFGEGGHGGSHQDLE
jgi:hypothetical protein